MNRQLVPALLMICVCSLTVAVEPAAAQYPYAVAWGQPQPAAVGTYLTPTSAYPLGGMYLQSAMPVHPGSHLYYRTAQAEPALVPTPNVATQAQPVPLPPSGMPYRGSVQCQCERCRRARGEWTSQSPGLFDELWELEQRKNSFLKRMFFGD